MSILSGMTLDQVNQQITLARLQEFGGHRAKTAESLGIGLRTLTMWLRGWAREGTIPQLREFCVKTIRAKSDVAVGQETIKAGAVGVLHAKGDCYTFDPKDVQGLPVGAMPAYDVEPVQKLVAAGVFEEVREAGTATLKTTAQSGKNKLTRLDLTKELWREYAWIDPCSGKEVSKRFNNPVAVYLYRGCTTHRVLHLDKESEEICTLVPSIGMHGCAITFKNKDLDNPVNF